MTAKTAKLFINGGSQAVRLPAEFRFPAGKEIYIRRDSVTGEVILSRKPASSAWSEFFAVRAQARVPSDFLSTAPLPDSLPAPQPEEP